MGAFWYFFGNPPKQVEKARFKLTTGPLLILFDDSPVVDLPPEMRDMAVRCLIDEFERTGVNSRVVPLARLNELRQQRRDVDDHGKPRGIREVGRMVDAEQVLAIQPKEFSIPSAPEQVMEPAKIAVALKVINVKAEERGELRLWPVSEEGELVTVTISAAKTRDAKTTGDLLQTMASNLAAEIALLFHDHEVKRPEDR